MIHNRMVKGLQKPAPATLRSPSHSLAGREALDREPPAQNGSAFPAIVQEALCSPGQPLDSSTRAFMESRFGHDFSRVRVHTDSKAAQSAQAVNALAYAVGPNVVFGAGQYAPGSLHSTSLLAHELTHVVQGGNTDRTLPTKIADPHEVSEREAAQVGALALDSPCAKLPVCSTGVRMASKLWRATAEELSGAATYPTAGERTSIQEIVNPQQQQATAQGTAVPPVTDPAGFQTDMTQRMHDYINDVLPGAQARQASSVVLSVPELTALADIAQPEVNAYYATYLQAAVHSPAEQARRANYLLSAHVQEVPTAVSQQTDDTAHDWVASRMHQEGGDLLQQYHVVSGDSGARDQLLFNQVRDHIFNSRTSDLRTIILFHPGYESGGEAYIQRHLTPEYTGQSAQATRRRGRWRTLGTTIHEMLHAVAHEDFDASVRGLEESGIAVEGFAEYFTRPVYNSLNQRAINDNTLRASIEGVQASYIRPPDRRGYEPYVQGVIRIRDILGGNEENLKVAFFLGRIEYLGLGGWNESEAATRRYPGNTLGAAALLSDNGQGLFRIYYGRVMFGRGGALQLQLGGTVNYLTQGERLSVGGTTALQYSWPNVYIRGGLDVAVSTSLTQPPANAVRLDLLPGVEAGVRIGVTRVGAGVYLLIPVAGGPVSERTVRVAAGIGVSLAF